MMKYERLTAAPIREVLELAEEILADRIPIRKESSDRHSIRLTGGDGAVTIHAHKHGMDTVVSAETDQVRTSRLDTEVQYFLTLLPYQPGDRRDRPGTQPAGLSRSIA
jgi:hypothetical protein